MRKLTLDVEALSVQSFETTPADAIARGTVLGRGAIGGVDVAYPYPQQTYPNGCPSPLCVDTPMASCDGSCGNSCYASCNGTCQSCASCVASCNGSCVQTCGDSCAPTCGPLCGPPPVDQIHRFG